MLNKIYWLVQAGRFWYNVFCDDRTAMRFDQSEAGPCAFHKFDKEVAMMVVVHVDDILTHAKDLATMERSAAEIEGKFKVKSMVEKFGVEKARRTPPSLGVPTLSQSGRAANHGGGGRYVEVPVLRSSGGAHKDGNDDTARYCVRGTRCDQVLEKPWTGASQKYGDKGHTIPASHERVGDHVR